MKVLFLICLLLASSTSLYASNDSLEETCKKVTKSKDSYEYCVTSLQVVPGSQTADAYNLTVMVAELVKSNFTFAYAKYAELSKQSGLSNDTLQSIRVCLENYYDTSLVDGPIYLAKKKEYDNMVLQLTAVSANAETCQEAFEEGGEISLLVKIDNDVIHLSCLAINFANLCQKM